MTTSNRQSYYPAIDAEPTPAQIALHLRNLYSAVNNHDQAIEAVNDKVGTVNNTITKTITETVSGGGSPAPPPLIPSLGGVSDQMGVTSYTTQQSDNGAKIIVGDASPVSVVLNSAVTTPWFTIIDNDSTAVANLSTTSGIIHGEQAIEPGGFGIVYFDGTNFWCGATGVMPQNAPAIAHEFLTAYNAATGAFSQAQPAYSDLTGTPTLPANTPAVAHEWISAYNSGTGAFTQSQPGFADISGTLQPGQVLSASTTSFGGSSMTAGQRITTTVTITGASTGMAAMCSPESDPGAGFVWHAFISAANTVTVCLTCVAAGTPVAAIYSVRVLP